MLHDHNGSPLVHQTLEHAQEGLHVARVQADGRLVKHKDGVRLAAAHLASELEALGLAARERWCGLAQRKVAQAQVMQGLELLAGALEVGHVRQSLVYGEGHELRQRKARAVRALLGAPDACGRGAVAASAAVRAVDVHVGQKLHVKRYLARAVAGRAAQAARVVREVPGLVARLARGVRVRVGPAQVVEDAAVGCHRGAHVGADGRGVYEVGARDARGVKRRHVGGQRLARRRGRKRGNERLEHKRGLSGAGDARHGHQTPLGNVHAKRPHRVEAA